MDFNLWLKAVFELLSTQFLDLTNVEIRGNFHNFKSHTSSQIHSMNLFQIHCFNI
jgi:hypothetical protein